jgi:hypothetical protein
LAKLCVKPGARGMDVDVTLDNAFAGHGWPSGAMPDRRAWVEFIAYKDGAEVFSSGVVKDNEGVHALVDPSLFQLRDRTFRTDGSYTPMFWEAKTYESKQLSAATTNDRSDPAFFHATTQTYELVGLPDRLTMRVRIRPIDHDLVDDLVASKDLDPSFKEKLNTFTLSNTVLEWKKEMGFRCVP